MGTSIQVVFDCLDPDRIARFWAEVLGYRLQPPPEGHASWEEFLRSIGVPEAEWNDASAIIDPDGGGPRIYFQRVETPKSGKNRVHLDVNAGGRGPEEERRRLVDAAVERLVGLGAAKLRLVERPHERWVVMEDPEGNEFCVQ